jgi:hypothetical protein
MKKKRDRRAMAYGRAHEKRALAAVAQHLGVTLERATPMKRCAPDGVVVGDPSALVEVKCPYSLMQYRGSLEKYYSQSCTRLLWKGTLNTLRNKWARLYYRQCQLYLQQRDARVVYFGVWTPFAGCVVVPVYPDTSWRLDQSATSSAMDMDIKSSCEEKRGDSQDGKSDGTTTHDGTGR